MDRTNATQPPSDYLRYLWMKDQELQQVERYKINGMPAITGRFDGSVNGHAATIILVAIQWKPQSYARFQIAVPRNSRPSDIRALMSVAESFIPLSAEDKRNARPDRIEIFTAHLGQRVEDVARKQPFRRFYEETFRVLNGLRPNDVLQKNQQYKRIVGN